MKKHLKKITSLFLVFTLIFAFSTVSYAATQHKVNGASTPTGGTLKYYSQITRDCNAITADGDYYGSGSGTYYAVVVVQKGLLTVAHGIIPLDGKEHTLDSYVNNNYTTGTYKITVTPSGGSMASYDVSTHFYY